MEVYVTKKGDNRGKTITQIDYLKKQQQNQYRKKSRV